MSETRSFRFFQEANSPPEKTSADYTESEMEMFREQFKPSAKRYRFISRVYLAAFLVLLIQVIFAWMSGTSLDKWIPFLYFELIGIVVISLSSILSQLFCPACKHNLDGNIRTFCPE